MKIAIIGGHARAGDIAHYDDSWQMWGLNAIRPPWIARWHAMFNLHRFAHLVRDWRWQLRKDIEWAQAHRQVPFYVLDPWPRKVLPNQMIFPKRRLLAMPNGQYHAGSFDWMVAFAVLQGAKAISLHGVRLALDGPADEPISARACLEYWCGYAAGRGVTVLTARTTELFWQYHLVKSRSLYGYDDIHLVEQR